MLFCSTDDKQKSAAASDALDTNGVRFSAVCYRSDRSALLDKVTIARPENNAVDVCAVQFCAVCCMQ